MDGKTLGDKIRAARKKMGLSMDNVAELSGYAKSYISKIENGVYPDGESFPKWQPFLSVMRAVDMDRETIDEAESWHNYELIRRDKGQPSADFFRRQSDFYRKSH